MARDHAPHWSHMCHAITAARGEAQRTAVGNYIVTIIALFSPLTPLHKTVPAKVLGAVVFACLRIAVVAAVVALLARTPIAVSADILCAVGFAKAAKILYLTVF